MKNQKNRYKIFEKKSKVKLDQPKTLKLSKFNKIFILIVMYVLCCIVIIGLVLSIMY